MLLLDVMRSQNSQGEHAVGGNLRQRVKTKYCTHNIAFAPLAAAVVHNMKITSFAYYWAVEIMKVIRLRPRPNVELFMRRTIL